VTTAREEARLAGSQRRVVALRVLICVLLALEATTYGVLSPLLPQLVEELRIGEPSVGLITGAYTTGMLPACIALIVVRRPLPDLSLVLAGVVSLLAGCLVMAVPLSFAGVVTARLLLGLGAGFCFGGGTRWLVRSAPGRENFYFGLGWGMLSLGTAVGPIVGAVALEIGTAPAHVALAGIFAACLLALGALGAASASREGPARSSNDTARIAGLVRQRSFAATLTPLVVPALTIGLLFTLVPLRLAGDERVAWVAPSFGLAAIIGAAASPLAGHLLATVGDRLMLVVSMAATATALAVAAWPLGPVVLAVATVLVLGITNQTVVVAAEEQLRRKSDAFGSPGAASAFIPLVFAVFETVGAVVGAQAASIADPLAFLLVALVAVACLGHQSSRSTTAQSA